jgi:hypothetical protein
VKPASEDAGQVANFAQPGILAAGSDQLVALPAGEGVFQAVQGCVHDGGGVTALDRIKGNCPDISTVDRLRRGVGGFK